MSLVTIGIVVHCLRTIFNYLLSLSIRLFVCSFVKFACDLTSYTMLQPRSFKSRLMKPPPLRKKTRFLARCGTFFALICKTGVPPPFPGVGYYLLFVKVDKYYHCRILPHYHYFVQGTVLLAYSIILEDIISLSFIHFTQKFPITMFFWNNFKTKSKFLFPHSFVHDTKIREFCEGHNVSQALGMLGLHFGIKRILLG